MKPIPNLFRSITAFFFCFWICAVHAQKITPQDCIKYFQTKSVTAVNESLIAKGWENNTIDGYSFIGEVIWTYDKDYYDEKAKGWFHANYVDGQIDMVKYQVQNETSRKAFASMIKSAGFKETGSGIEDGYLVTNYANDKYILKYSLTYEESDYSYSSMSVHVFKMIRKFGLYDDENGEQLSFEEEDGEEYVSERTWYVNGKKNGYARSYNADGVLLSEATYKNDVLEGPFTSYALDGTIIRTGFFQNGLVNGLVTEFDPETQHKVSFYKKNGLYEGPCTVEVNGVVITKGSFINNEKSGPWLEHFYSETALSKGQLMPDFQIQTNYVLGLKEGKQVVFTFESRDTFSVRNYRNDQLNGEALYYIIDGDYTGKIKERSNFTDGQLDGNSFLYYDLVNGNPDYTPIKASYVYRNGKKNGPSSYEVPNDIQLIGNYSNDQKTGVWTENYYDGAIVNTAKGSYANDKMHGEWTFREDDVLTRKENFAHGRIIERDYYFNEMKTATVDFDNDELINTITKFDKNETRAVISKVQRKNDGLILTLTHSPSADRKEIHTLYISSETLGDNRHDEYGRILFLMTLFDNIPNSQKEFSNGEFSIDGPTETVKGGLKNGKPVGQFSVKSKTNNGLIYKYTCQGDQIADESFSFPDGTLFTGEMEVEYLRQSIKVKEGLRNGVTVIYDESGKVVEKRKYKGGVVKE